MRGLFVRPVKQRKRVSIKEVSPVQHSLGSDRQGPSFDKHCDKYTQLAGLIAFYDERNDKVHMDVVELKADRDSYFTFLTDTKAGIKDQSLTFVATHMQVAIERWIHLEEQRLKKKNQKGKSEGR